MNNILDHALVLLLPLFYLFIFRQICASPSPSRNHQCPIDFNYVSTIPWDSSSCKNNIENSNLDVTTNCCQTLTSLYGVGTARYLKETSLFRLKDIKTSISCLSNFQNSLINLNLHENLTSICFNPQQFVNTSNVCAGIQTKNDWVKIVGPSTPLDTGCNRDLSDLTACDACVMAGFQVQSKLIAVDGNYSHSKGCFHYTILYAAGIVNELGPMSFGALSCIFGLPLLSQKVSKSSGNWAIVLGFVGGGSGFFAIVATTFLVFLWLKWSGWRKGSEVSRIFSNLESGLDDNGLLNWRPKNDSLWFNSRDLAKATDGFSAKNFLGRGQFGIVYKGILPDRTLIAVKKITDSDFDQRDFEFHREVEIISTLRHRNLVSLRGCCIDEGESQKYLVYAYMPNGNLHDHLFPLQKGVKSPMSWPHRKSIILDVANALAYLHYGVKPPIYHRDIKPTNILLDSFMRARVADFGLAKQGLEGESHLTTRIAGTHGYLAPEYALYGQLTAKSDVYSFGIVILEIMCGRKALNFTSSTYLITDWAWPSVKQGKVEKVLDPSLLVDRYPKMIMERFVKVGILCAHLMVALRPNILEALKMLEGDIEIFTIPDRPFYANNEMLSSIGKRR